MGLISRSKNALKAFIDSDEKKLTLTANTDIRANKKSLAGDSVVSKTKNGDITVNNNNITNNINIQPDKDGKIIIPDEIKKAILAQFNAGKLQLIEYSSDKDLDTLNHAMESKENSELINFFKDGNKIPPRDQILLKTGLYAKSLLESGDRDGYTRVYENAMGAQDNRGKNILKLAVSGHFKDYIMPLFDLLRDDNSTISPRSEYEEIVKYLPGTIFVNNNMHKEMVFDDIEKKINERNKYHIQVKYISVNGLGESAKLIKSIEPDVLAKFADYEIALELKALGEFSSAKLKIKLPDLRV